MVVVSIGKYRKSYRKGPKLDFSVPKSLRFQDLNHLSKSNITYVHVLFCGPLYRFPS